jgi:hypothetical protein
MKTLLLFFLMSSASLAQAAIHFSAATPLSKNQQRALTRILNTRCQIQGYTVVESRTLLGNGNVYFTNFAVMTFGGNVASQIDTSVNSAARVLWVRGPLCH